MRATPMRAGRQAAEAAVRGLWEFTGMLPMSDTAVPCPHKPPCRCPDCLRALADSVEQESQRIYEVRRRIVAGFYDRADVIRTTAERVLESGDLPMNPL